MTHEADQYTPPADLDVSSLGKGTYTSPLDLERSVYVTDDDTVVFNSNYAHICKNIDDSGKPPVFEAAGPREKLYYNPSGITCGIVTCGGLCPGLNDVIRTITLCLLWQYNVKEVLGFRYGYEGMSSNARYEPMKMTPEVVDGIHHTGGTILGSSRGHQEPEDMVDTLERYNVKALFVIGGDGTFKGAHAIVKEISKRGKDISVVGVPKTIDNDIQGCENTFGFATSVSHARAAITSAHEEARSAFNGIGLVKLMGRDSGFIAVNASLANSDVNFCLIPESNFELEGKNGLLNMLERRFSSSHHAVIVAAEGAGQEVMAKTGETDASGNVRYGDIGLFLKDKITAHFKAKNIPLTLKYIDPSYTIRSCPANAQDSVYCLMLGQMAVHAAMAGKTDMFVGYWNRRFTHVPFAVATAGRKKINPKGHLWQVFQSMNDLNSDMVLDYKAEAE